MINLINSIVSKDYVNADSIINEKVESIMKKKFEEAKKMCAAKIEEEPHTMNRSSSELTRLGVVEEENLEELFGFGTKKTMTSDEAWTKGEAFVKKEPAKAKVYNLLDTKDKKRKYTLELQ